MLSAIQQSRGLFRSVTILIRTSQTAIIQMGTISSRQMILFITHGNLPMHPTVP